MMIVMMVQMRNDQVMDEFLDQISGINPFSPKLWVANVAEEVPMNSGIPKELDYQ